MADLLQSSATTATQAPSYYTNYLNSLATQGQSAAQNAKFVGATPLQMQAFGDVAQNVGNYKPELQQAQGALGQATNTSPLNAANQYLNNANVDQSQLAQQYMSPYTQDVVNSIGTLGQRNIQQNLAPQATAAAVGSGQFGSQRGAQVLGQTIQNANTDILAQQNQALQAGYQNAMANAQKQQALQAQLGQTAGNLAATGQGNLINAATVGGNLAGQTQALGLGDVNALSTLGGQQQTISQNAQMFPLQALSQQAALMRGLTVPTASVQTFQGSPLSAIASLGAGAAGLFAGSGVNGTGPSLFQNITGSKSLGDLATSGVNYLKGLTGGTTAPATTNSSGQTGAEFDTSPTNLDAWSNYYNTNPPTTDVTPAPVPQTDGATDWSAWQDLYNKQQQPVQYDENGNPI